MSKSCTRCEYYYHNAVRIINAPDKGGFIRDILKAALSFTEFQGHNHLVAQHSDIAVLQFADGVTGLFAICIDGTQADVLEHDRKKNECTGLE